MQLSGGPYSYNRFDTYEGKLGEAYGAQRDGIRDRKYDMLDGPELTDEDKKEAKREKEKLDGEKAAKADKVAAARARLDRDIAARNAKKKDSKPSDVHAAAQAAGEAKQKERDANIAKGLKPDGSSRVKKEELNNEETGDTVMENNQRMAMYSRALGVMGAHYSGPGFGVSPIEEKKADKDYDGDGKVESSKEEYFGSKDKAIKKAMKKEEVTVEEGYKEMDTKRQMNQAKGKSKDSPGPEQAKNIKTATAAHSDPKVGGMAREMVKSQEARNKAKGENKKGLEKAFKKDSEGHSSMEEEVSITKEMVVEYLVKEGYASNEVSAEILHTHVSDEFLAQIEEKMISE